MKTYVVASVESVAVNDFILFLKQNLLSDPVPEVRLVAVRGVGRVLNIYWELIPADVSVDFIYLASLFSSLKCKVIVQNPILTNLRI